MKESQLKQLVKAVIKEMRDPDDPEICSACNGSGEGSADGTRCQTCKGSGAIRHGDEEDPDYPPPTPRGRYLSGDTDEASNPEAWRKSEFPSGEPPEPQDAGEAPEEEEPLKERIASLEYALNNLEKKQMEYEVGSDGWDSYSGKIRQLLKRLIELQVESERGVNEDHGLGFGHNVSVPGDENTMNKSTVNEEETNNIPEKVKQLVKTVGAEKALDYIFQWVQARKINSHQFKMLIYLCLKERL